MGSREDGGRRGGGAVGGGGSLKVYSENDKANSIRNPVTVRKAAALSSAKNTEGTLKKMENNSKGKGVSSAYTKVGRKALVDVSNIPGNTTRNDGSKHVKGEQSAIVKRVSVRPGGRTVNVLSRKSLMGKVSETQVASDVRTSKKDSMSSLDDQWANTKGQGRESFLADSRTSRIPTVPTRKSLPVLRRMNQADTSRSKENAECSEKDKDTVGFSVKAKLGTKVVYRLSNSKNQLWRNRRSDGFMTSSARDHNKVAPPPSKNSVKPNGKTTSMASIAQRTLKTKVQSGVNKQVSVTAIASKKIKEVVRSSLSEDIPSMVSHEVAQGKPSFNDNTKASTNSSDIVTKKKSNRRRSYTSLLMASSKLLEEYGQVAGQEKLPSIDDDCNQLEVAEYVDEIYQYYWVMEAQNPLPENYMSIQTDITPHMRGILINWLIEVHYKFELMQETLYLMVTLFDRYLSQVKIKKNEVQLVGLTALLLASKYEDFWHPRIKDLISISAKSYTRDQMLGMEKLMLKTLKFRLNVPTPYVFMLRFLKAARSDLKLEHLAFYLIELSLVEYEALKFKPSLLCASAIYVARCTLRMTPVWTPLLGKHARYDVSQLRDCAEMILRVHKAAEKGKLKVTYEKYTNCDLSSVAAIKPLESLP